MRTYTKFGSVVLGSVLALAATSARAQLLAYEGFDYGLGNLSTLNGGSGWANAWAQNGGGSAANSQVILGSYAYTDINGYSLVTTGNRVIFTGDGSAPGANIGGAVGGAQPLRRLNFVRGHDATNGSYSTWVSFLALRTGNPTPTPGAPPADYLHGRAAGVQFFHNANTTATGGGDEKFGIGRGTQSSETDTSMANDTWGVIQQGNANAFSPSAVNFAAPPADFILMRIDHVGQNNNSAGNADTLRVWINPPDLNLAPSDASANVIFTSDQFLASLGVTRDWVFDRIRLFGGSQQGLVGSTYSYGEINMDELRIGVGFGDVTPNVIPEPAFAAIAGFGVMALVSRLRKKR